MPFEATSPFDVEAGFRRGRVSKGSDPEVPLCCELPLACIFVSEKRSFLGGGGETPPSSESDDDASIA